MASRFCLSFGKNSFKDTINSSTTCFPFFPLLTSELEISFIFFPSVVESILFFPNSSFKNLSMNE